MAIYLYWMAYPRAIYRHRFSAIEVEHGFPLPFLTRYHYVPYNLISYGGSASPWWIGRRFDLDLLPLAADLLVAAAIGGAVYLAAALQFKWRRWFQYGCLELLELSFVSALVAWYFAEGASTARQVTGFHQRARQLGVSCDPRHQLWTYQSIWWTVHSHGARCTQACVDASRVSSEADLQAALRLVEQSPFVADLDLGSKLLTDHLLATPPQLGVSGLSLDGWLPWDRSGVTDAGLASLANNTRLHSLVAPRQCTDRSGTVLASLSELRFLSLSDAQVTDAILPSVGRLPRLVHFEAGRTQLTGQGLWHLRGCDRLRTLQLWQTQVEDDGLEALADLPRLEAVNLSSCRIGDAGATQLANVRSLRSLNLWGTQVGDRGAKALAQLEKLELLILDNTQIGDASIDALLSLRKLRILAVAGTKISPQGFAKLKSFATQNPRLKVFEHPLAMGYPLQLEQWSSWWSEGW
jgi:hypothetical protein